MAAQCERAGRDHNEDNFQLSNNLSANSWGFKENEVVELSEKGALLVVCDGMGGMNAGERASAVAVETIKEWFSSEKLTKTVISSQEAIKKYINDAIVAADSIIKEEGKRDKSKEGMGTTIVMAWLIHNDVYVAWCGDSRAYRFNPSTGFEQLSNDHSYVQELVDEGKLTRELAFDHPNSNIVTRSLGDPRKRAKPDIKCFLLRNQDIFLLCSDGLSGVLRDHEMAAIIEQNTDDIGKCKDTLWDESKKAGWDDNVTLVLCQIVACDNQASQKTEISADVSQKADKKPPKSKKVQYLVLWFVLFLFGAAFGYYGYKWYDNRKKECESINDLRHLLIDLEQKHKIIERFNNEEIKVPEETSKRLTNLYTSLQDKSLKEDSCALDLTIQYKDIETKINDVYNRWKDTIQYEISLLLETITNDEDLDFLKGFSISIDSVLPNETDKERLYELLEKKEETPSQNNPKQPKYVKIGNVITIDDTDVLTGYPDTTANRNTQLTEIPIDSSDTNNQ